MADDSGLDSLTLHTFNALADDVARAMLLATCSSPAWSARVAAGRPYADFAGLLASADRAVEALTDSELDDALAGHPRIGEPARAGQNLDRSAREQAGVDGADASVLAALAAGNRAYEERFHHVYLVCASGLSGTELLARLRSRLGNDPQTERGVVRQELANINRLRLTALVRQESS